MTKRLYTCRCQTSIGADHHHHRIYQDSASDASCDCNLLLLPLGRDSDDHSHEQEAAAGHRSDRSLAEVAEVRRSDRTREGAEASLAWGAGRLRVATD